MVSNIVGVKGFRGGAPPPGGAIVICACNPVGIPGPGGGSPVGGGGPPIGGGGAAIFFIKRVMNDTQYCKAGEKHHRQARIGMRTTYELADIEMTGDGRAKNFKKL